MRPRLAVGALLLAVLPGCDSSPTTPTPPPTVCAYQLSAPVQSFNSTGGTTNITVATSAQCTWTARADASWITVVSGASGTGPGSIGIAVASNPDAAAREGNVSVADQSLRMTQEGREPAPCSYTLTSGSQRVGPEGGSGVATVTTEARCSWTATTTESWLTVSPAQGTGTANVTFTAAPWSGTTERSAAIRVADQSVTIRQDPPAPTNCEYAVNPVELTLHWHQTGGQVQITTRGGCTWTVTAGEPWITVIGPSAREGDGTVQFSTSVYTDESRRSAPIQLRWPTPTAGQNVWVTQEGCRYGLSQSNVSFPAAGGTAYVDVYTQPLSSACSIGCSWAAVSSQPEWIRITSQMPRGGDDRFYFEVLKNETGVVRTGRISVMGKVVLITQTP